MNKKEKILMVAILLFIATLFFPNFPVLNVFISGVFLLSCFLFNPLAEKLQLLKERQFIWWMLGFFGLVLISIILSDNKQAAARYLDSRLPLLAVPVSIGLIYISKEVRDKILLGIAFLITLSVSICLAWSIRQYFHTGDSSLLYNDSFTKLTGQQSIYISILVNISVYIFSFFLFFKKINRLQQVALIIIIIYLFFISYLLASRNMMLVLYLTTFFFCCWYILKKRKYVQGIASLSLLLVIIVLVFLFFPKTLNRFKELAYTNFNYQQIGPESHYNSEVIAGQWNGANLRLAIWKCGWTLFQQYPILGTGLGDKKDRLQEIYRDKDFQFAIRSGKNLHNNYLDILVSMGITGLLVFLMAWLLMPLINCWQKQDGLSIIIILTFAIAMITEIYLDRSLGGMLFGFFIVFLLVDKRKG